MHLNVVCVSNVSILCVDDSIFILLLRQSSLPIIYTDVLLLIIFVEVWMVASWLVHLSPDWVIQVWTLAGDTVSCSCMGKTVNSNGAFLHPEVKMGTVELLGKPN